MTEKDSAVELVSVVSAASETEVMPITDLDGQQNIANKDKTAKKYRSRLSSSSTAKRSRRSNSDISLDSSSGGSGKHKSSANIPTTYEILEIILGRVSVGDPVTTQELCSIMLPTPPPRENVQSILDILVILGILQQLRQRDTSIHSQNKSQSKISGKGTKSSHSTKPHYCLASYARTTAPLYNLREITGLVQEKIHNISRIRYRNAELSKICFNEEYASSDERKSALKSLILKWINESDEKDGFNLREDPLYVRVCKLLDINISDATVGGCSFDAPDVAQPWEDKTVATAESDVKLTS